MLYIYILFLWKVGRELGYGIRAILSVYIL